MEEQSLLHIINSLLLGKYIIAHCADPEWKHLRKEKGFPHNLFTFNKQGKIVGVDMDKDYVEALRGGKDKSGKFVLPEYCQKWDPMTTDMMYMAISRETEKIEAIITFSRGAREHLLCDNIQSISVGHKEKRVREITYTTLLSREDIENCLYISLLAGARAKYSRVSELLFFFVCALETSFTHVTLWILHSRKRYPLQPLISLYTSRFGMIYPRTTPSPSRPFYEVLQPDGEPLHAPFVMFQKRENVIAHGLRTLAQIYELPLRTIIEIPDEAELDDVGEDTYDRSDEVAQSFDGYDDSTSESEDDLDSDDFEYKLEKSEKIEKISSPRSEVKPTTRQNSGVSLADSPRPDKSNSQKGKSKKTTESPKQGKSPNPKSPLPKKPSTPQSASKRITRSMKNLSTEDNLNESLEALKLV